MVLESITTPLQAEKHPLLLFLLGFSYVTLGVFLSNWIFVDQASMVMVVLTVVAALPLIYHTLRLEEKKDVVLEPTKSLWHMHGRALLFFLTLFIGMSVAFSLWYVVLPTDIGSNMFEVQTQTISNLNQHVTGNVTQTALLSKIFLNNIKVLIFCILFSFLYGTGAMFILTWNASVIGAAAGNFIRTHLAQFADIVGLQKMAAYFYVVSLSILRYAIHGVPEIFAYIIAGLAGGILSFAIVRQDVGTRKFERVLLDISDLVLLSVLVLSIAAALEVYVTPALF